LNKFAIFSKFFSSEYDFRKSNATSNYFAALGLPYLRVLSTDDEQLMSTTEFVRGRDAVEVFKELAKTDKRKTERKKLVKEVVEILAETHVKGGARENAGIRRRHYSEDLLRDMQLNLKTHFLHSYMLSRMYGKDDLADMEVADGQKPDSDFIMEAHRRIMASTDILFRKKKGIFSPNSIK